MEHSQVGDKDWRWPGSCSGAASLPSPGVPPRAAAPMPVWPFGSLR